MVGVTKRCRAFCETKPSESLVTTTKNSSKLSNRIVVLATNIEKLPTESIDERFATTLATARHPDGARNRAPVLRYDVHTRIIT